MRAWALSAQLGNSSVCMAGLGLPPGRGAVPNLGVPASRDPKRSSQGAQHPQRCSVSPARQNWNSCYLQQVPDSVTASGMNIKIKNKKKGFKGKTKLQPTLHARSSMQSGVRLVVKIVNLHRQEVWFGEKD